MLLPACEVASLEVVETMERLHWELSDGVKAGARVAATGEFGGHEWLTWFVDASYADPSRVASPHLAPGGSARQRAGSLFCLYGCITAHVVAALSLVKSEPGSAPAMHDAMQRLLLARQLLGRGRAFDLASSSGWGASPGLAAAILEELLEEGASASPAGPSALELARRHQPCDPVLAVDCWCAELEARPPWKPGSALVVTVIGEHAPLCHDIAGSLVEAAHSSGEGIDASAMRLRLVFAGQFYLCQVVPGGCQEDTMSSWMRGWVGRWEADVGTPGEEAGALLAALRGHRDPRAATPDLFLCVDHEVFCWLLRRRAAGRREVEAAPALHLLGMVFLQYVPVHWRPELMADFRSTWGLREENGNAFGCYCEALSLQAQWQMGVVIPYVPTVGLAIRAGAVYDPPGAASGRDRSVVVLRSPFWQLPSGVVFAALLERFAEANRATHGARLDWMTSFVGGSLAPREKQGPTESFASMARHTCALYVPNEISLVKFRDAYGIGLPLLVPADAWMLRLLRDMYSRWGQLHAEYGERLALPPGAFQAGGGYVGVRGWPHEPFYEPSRDPLARLEYWHALADHSRYPHVVRFASLAELFDHVATADWNLVSVRMRAHFQRVAANVRRFYQSSLQTLLSLKPS